MEIEYQYTKEDFIEFYKIYYLSSSRKRIWAVLCLTFFAIAYFGKEPFELKRFLVGTTVSVTVILAAYYFIPLLISLIRLNKALAKEKSFSEKRKLTVVEEGLLVESENGVTTRNWESIVSTGAVGEFIFLTLVDKRMLIFRKSYFQSDAEATNFLGLVQSKISQISRPFKYPLPNTNKKPPYWLGLLCLIPVVGAVVGIVLLLNGISKYKDKWIIIIGAGGIIYTFALAFFFANPLNKGMRAAFVPHAQMAVNDLMKSVEFYKLEHGVYPDSLGQIKDKGIIWTDDPIQTAAFDKNGGKTKFNYQKVGDHYYLFSSGVDGIPGTADDIYPQVAKEDSSKFGLIHK